ncbi:MAG: hypoxanthine phosphoribosyltransferase [Methanocorpusculum sp.]|nr:hypoxanthine phosphoribosyltransferase [Methanocorpusculum sp.]
MLPGEEKIDLLLSEEEVLKRIRELGAEIEKDYADREITFVITLKGAVFFACELAKRISRPVIFEFVRMSSYSGTKSTGTVNMLLDVEPEKIAGRDVIIIEDVIETGLTMQELKDHIQAMRPASLTVCTFVDKHECRTVPFEAEYVGFTLGREFLLGWGFDVDQMYRNLPYVGVVRQ